MSGFLWNLLSRSRGTFDVIRPRVPALFEPSASNGPAGEWDGEAEAFGGARSEPGLEVARQASAPVDVTAGEPVTTSRRIERPSLPPQREGEEASTADNPRQRALDDRRQERVAPRPRSRTASVSVEIMAATPDTSSRGAKHAIGQRHEAATSATSPTADVWPRQEVLPAREAEAARRSATSILAPRSPLTPPSWRLRFEPASTAPSTAAIEPSVHVTIGRIEVRAIPEPASPRRARNQSPVMTLDEYLKNRPRGGSR